MKSYIIKPKSVKKSAILEREYIFSASRHNDIQINSNFDFLVNLIDISKKSVSLKNQKKYFNYVEIGSINTTTGYIEPTYKKSIDISTDSVYQLQKDDILISTVRTYLGGIGIVNQKEQDFVASKALIVLRELKKDINKYYLFGILRTSFFIEQTNLILNASMYPRMDKDSFDKLKIPFPTTANHPNPEKVENLVALIVQNIIDKEEQIKIKNRQIDELIERELKENQRVGSFSYAYPKISEIKEEIRLDTGLYEREFKEIDFLIRNYKKGFNLLDVFVEKFFSGTTPNFFEKLSGNYPYFVRPTEYNDKRLYTDLRKIHFDKNISKYRIDKKEGIILPRKGGTNSIYKPENFNVLIGDSVKFGIFKDINISFLASFLSSNIIKFQLERIKSKTNGGSLTEKNLRNLVIPNFSESKQQEIAILYYNPLEKNKDLDLENYIEKEQTRNREVGIFQLNMEIFSLREQLEDLVQKIVMEEKIELRFKY